jgi:hypothetical protein
MACDLTLGRLEDCKTSVGGLKAVYFVNYGDMTTITYNGTNTDVIDEVNGAPSAYKYELKGTNSFDQTITSSRENGTTFFDQSLKLQLKKLTPKDHKELKLLTYARPQVLVEDYNGNIFLAGLEHGMEVTGGTIVSGTAMGDLSGYTLELKGMERIPANFLGNTLAEVGFTVVSGT